MATSGASVPAAQPDTRRDDATTDPARDVWHGRLLREALDLPSLTATQRGQIQGLLAQKESVNAGVRSAHAELLNAVADAIDAGYVSASILAPKAQAVVAAVQAAQPSNRAILESLHAVLTPEQRAEIASEVQTHMQAAGEQRSEERAGHVSWLANQLDLTPAQEEAIESNMRAFNKSPGIDEGAEADAECRRLLRAFAGDTFVMSQVAPPKSSDEIQTWVDKLVLGAQAAAPVLTAGQRGRAASMLRGWASRPAR
jgi:Spy/CpxP family protein refolding chaperone